MRCRYARDRTNPLLLVCAENFEHSTHSKTAAPVENKKLQFSTQIQNTLGWLYQFI